jgi:HEAT repeat protein
MVPGQPNSIAITVTLPPQAMAQAMRQQAISALQESGGSAQRELAVRDLIGRDHADNPQVIQALMQAMANDPSANVRLSAARSLGRMGTKGDEVIAALVRQRTDSDARVRSEGDRAIVLILSGQEK